MQRRIRTITLDNLQFKVAPLTYDETEEFIRQAKENAAKQPPASEVEERKKWDEEQAARVLDTVVNALNLAANGDEKSKWDRKRLTGEVDMQTIIDLHGEYLRICGLRVPKLGEETAAAKPTLN
jgi:hypothetical protein